MANSINTNIAAYYAQANITAASTAASSSVARLSSGNRIVQASDDVASLATGTSLQTEVSALRTAQINVSQGSSLLQVADGALQQIQNILQQMKSVALQAGSGSLTNTDRGFLNQQFQALSSQIDTLSKGTTFNGVALIDGSLAQAATVSNATTQSKAADATITLSSNLTAGTDTISIAGLTLSAVAPGATATGLQFNVGNDAAATVANLATRLNTLGLTSTYASTLGKATYSAQGSTLSITARTGGALGNNFTLNVTGANGKAGLGGAFGGSTVNMFATNFTSATTSLTAATATAAKPFQDGNTITASVGTGASVNLYTVSTGDSLVDIVNGINTAQTTTGIKATLTYDSTNLNYNIQLHSTSATGAIAVVGGANYYNAVDRTNALNGATTSTNLFTDAMATRLGSSATLTAASSANPSAITSPFKTGSDLQISVNGGTLQTIATFADSETFTTLVTKINAHANSKALGLHAALNTAGNNIVITYADSTAVKTLAFSGGAKYYGIEGTAGAQNSNGLNNNIASGTLFTTGFATAATNAVGATSTGVLPIQNGDTLTLTINGGTAINLGTAATGTLAALATSINASDGAKQYGVHATVVQDENGLYNIKLSAAVSADPTSFVFGPGANANYTGVNAVDTTPTVTYGSSVTTTQLFTDTFEGTLAAAQTVLTLTGGTVAAAKPFYQGDVLSVIIGAGGTGQVGASVTISSALAATDLTLQKIVDNINTYAASNYTGITAELNDDGTNINLISSSPILAVKGGTTVYQSGTSVFNNNQTSTNILGTSAYTAGTDAAVVAVLNTALAGRAFDIGTLTVSINGASAVTVATTTAGMSLNTIISTINATPATIAAGIYASLDTTDASNYGIKFTVTDPTAAPITSIAFGGTAVSGAGVNGAAQAQYNNTPAAGVATNVGADLTAVAGTPEGTEVDLTTSTDTASHLATFGLAGGSDTGLGFNSTTVTGTIGDNLVTGLAQSAAKVILSFPDIAADALLDSGNFGSTGNVYLTVGNHNFSFVTVANGPDQIEIGSTLQETLDNAVATINSYGANTAVGDTAFQLNQVNVARNGNTIVIQGKGITDVTKITGAAADTVAISATFTAGATVSNGGLLNNSSRHSTSTFGIDTSAISNADFTGTIGGFTATYSGTNNTVDLAVKVGNFTYTANSVSTNPTGTDETVRFFSDTIDGKNGGYFDLQLAQDKGRTVYSTSDANAYATRVNAAFSGLSFNQSRAISSYNGTQSIVSGGNLIGSLIGSKVSAQLGDFSANKLTQIVVAAPPPAGGGDAVLTLTIDGEDFTSARGIGSQLGANQTYRLTSTTDTTHFVDFTTGSSAIDLSTSANALATQNALSSAFGVTNGAGALSFQVGSASSDTLSVSIGSAKTSSIFNGATLDVSTQAGAQAANDILSEAIHTVTSLRANVGALESRFNFAAAAIQSGVQNQDAARGQLLDTDIATESTAFATQQVKLQAGISVLAQANQQLQALLKLIG